MSGEGLGSVRRRGRWDQDAVASQALRLPADLPPTVQTLRWASSYDDDEASLERQGFSH